MSPFCPLMSPFCPLGQNPFEGVIVILLVEEPQPAISTIEDVIDHYRFDCSGSSGHEFTVNLRAIKREYQECPLFAALFPALASSRRLDAEVVGPWAGSRLTQDEYRLASEVTNVQGVLPPEDLLDRVLRDA